MKKEKCIWSALRNVGNFEPCIGYFFLYKVNLTHLVEEGVLKYWYKTDNVFTKLCSNHNVYMFVHNKHIYSTLKNEHAWYMCSCVMCLLIDM